jgi:hypothetical protein
VDVEIVPEPTPEEREAVLAALAEREPEPPGAYVSLWRAAGLDEED